MAQHKYTIANQLAAPLRADINNTLSAIVSNNSGATEPADRFAYMWWADTTSGILKQRNAANTAWINKLSLAGTALEAGNNLSDVASSVAAFTNIKQNATTTSTGVVEKATTAEAEAGTADKFPDAAGVLASINANALSFASAAENAAGAISGKAVDPLGIREAFNATGSAPVYACRAWVEFNGTGTVAIRADGNVSSITDNGTGDYTVNFAVAMPDANYAVAATVGNVSGSRTIQVVSKSAGSVRVLATTAGGAATDFEGISVMVFR